MFSSVTGMRHSALALSRASAAAALAHAMSLTVASLFLRLVQQKSRDWIWPMDCHTCHRLRHRKIMEATVNRSREGVQKSVFRMKFGRDSCN